MNFAFRVSSRKSERVAMRPALFQRKRRLQLCQPSRATQGKGWSLRLRAKEAKAGAFAYAGGKGWSLRLQHRPLNFQVPMRYEIILDVIGYRLLKAELGTVMSRSF